MKKYRCIVCEWIYDPAVGDPDGGIAPGTSFEDIPDDWVCPVCGVGKDQFKRSRSKSERPEKCETHPTGASRGVYGGVKKRERLLCSLRKIIIFVCRAFCAVQSKFI